MTPSHGNKDRIFNDRFVTGLHAIEELRRKTAGTCIAVFGGVAKRIVPIRPGRRVRWTFEVSADVGGKRGPGAKKTARTTKRARPLVKKAPAKSAAKPPTAKDSPAPAQRATTLRALVLVAAVVLVVAATAFPRHPAATAAASSDEHAERAAGDVAPSTPTIAPAPVPNVAPVERPLVVTTRAASEPSKKPSRKAAAKSAATVSVAPAVPEISRKNDFTEKPPAPEPLPSPPSPSTEAVLPALVTITGCLEVSTDGDTFRLADVEGGDAPKARSWRTGFLKKHPAPVMLVDPPDRAALTTNVGHRVAATGQLATRELKLHSLRVVSSSCN